MGVARPAFTLSRSSGEFLAPDVRLVDNGMAVFTSAQQMNERAASFSQIHPCFYLPLFLAAVTNLGSVAPPGGSSSQRRVMTFHLIGESIMGNKWRLLLFDIRENENKTNKSDLT